MFSFHQLPLLPTLQASLAEQGFTQLTEIQERALPTLLAGRSLVGVAETGSGKTLSYVLPLLHLLKTLEDGGEAVTEPGQPRGLVLVPGRELGEQVSRVFKSFTHTTRLRVRTALGGAARQVALQNVGGNFEVLVATPGRLGQLLDGGELRLGDVRMLVFDEADQMLDPGFIPVAKRILGECPKPLQVVLVSATLPDTLESAVSAIFSTPPERVITRGSQRLLPTLSTDNRRVVMGERQSLLLRVLREAPTASTILFANTREQCERMAKWLDEGGVPYASYWGQMDRTVRRTNLARFRKGEVYVLISTDLGGRGLDIDRVERVINVHLPHDPSNYLHRVGRTARAGRPGLVVNLVTDRDEPLMRALGRMKRGQ